MKISYGRTHIGSVRSVNEDCFGIFELGQATLCVVCDGIGGHRGGKQASTLAMKIFAEQVTALLREQRPDCAEPMSVDDMSIAQIKRILRTAAVQASRRVHTAAAQDATLAGMASTLVAALVGTRRAFVLHVGDSRLYAIGEAGVEKVTRDHSYIQYLLDVGRITPEQVKELAVQNYITQAIGAYDHVDADFCALELESYGVPLYLLLCSDGLYTMVSEEMMHKVLLSDGDLYEKVETLIDAANAAGGEDNVTAVVVEIRE